MSEQNVFQVAIIGVLLVCGYIYLFQLVSRRITYQIKRSVLAAVLLFAYAMIMGPLVYIISSLQSTEMLLFTLLMLLSCVVLFVSINGLIQNLRSVNKGALALFLVYILAMAYITLFSREFDKETSVYIFRTDLITRAIREKSLEPMKHILLNVAMFIPMGVMLPFVYPEKLNRWDMVIPLALMVTTLIETTQLLLRLGQADLTDIVANTLGAVVGFLGYRLFRRFSPL